MLQAEYSKAAIEAQEIVDAIAEGLVSTEKQGAEVVATVAALFAMSWSDEDTTTDDEQAINSLVGALPLGFRGAVAGLAVRNAFEILITDETSTAHRAVVVASELALSWADGDECWAGAAGWYRAEADRVMNFPEWAEHMAQACENLQVCSQRSEVGSSVGAFLARGRSELAAYRSTRDEVFEAAVQMGLAADSSRFASEQRLSLRLAEAAFLEAQTGEMTKCRAHALEALDLLDEVQSPGVDDFGAIKSLLAIRGVVEPSVQNRIFDIASSLTKRSLPSNDAVWHQTVLAGEYEDAGRWREAREQWQAALDIAPRVGVEGVLGLSALLGLVRTSIEIGEMDVANRHIDAAMRHLEEWPDEASRRTVELYRAMLTA